ncbi:hypothetical protein ACHAQH_008069 [Verticillium albo-atrum]
MAETAGLVLSGIAITTLFTSCVEIIEYFENGRNWICDLGLALVKVNLLKIRLSQLEDSLPEPGDESATIRSPILGLESLTRSEVSCNDWEVSVIFRGLSGVDEVLRRTSKLCRRYSYPSRKYEAAKHGHVYHTLPPSSVATASKRTDGAYRTDAIQTGDRLGGWGVFSRKMSWAVHDRKRFESLIADLDFLLSNLEKVAGNRFELFGTLTSSSSLETTTSQNNTIAACSTMNRKHNQVSSTSQTEVQEKFGAKESPCHEATRVRWNIAHHQDSREQTLGKNPENKEAPLEPVVTEPLAAMSHADRPVTSASGIQFTAIGNKVTAKSFILLNKSSGEQNVQDNVLDDSSAMALGGFSEKGSESQFLALYKKEASEAKGGE